MGAHGTNKQAMCSTHRDIWWPAWAHQQDRDSMQNTISERTTHRTLKPMGYSSRRSHRVPLMSTKNKKNVGYNSHRLTKIGQKKIGKTLPGLTSLDYCCDIQMVGSEFGVKNIKAWIHSALSQWFRLVVV